MKSRLLQENIGGHWVGKATAGAVCGLLLGIALSGVLVRIAPGAIDDPGKAEVAMLSVPLVWTAVLSAAFAFHTGTRAWAWLGGISIVAFAMLDVCKYHA